MAKHFCKECGKQLRTKTKTGMCRACYDVSPERSRIQSMATKKSWENGAFDGDEYRQKQSRNQKRLWSDPDYRKKQIEVWTPQKKREHAKVIAMTWKDPTIRQRRTEGAESPRVRKKISDASKAMWRNPKSRPKLLRARKEVWQDPEFCRKHSNSIRAAYQQDPEYRLKNSRAKKAHWQDPKFRRQHMGTNHHNWQGGKSFESYPPSFNDELKSYIRNRDEHKCVLCGESENDQAHDIHHCNYIKTDNAPDNLVCLCKHCHGKTSHNRTFWCIILSRVAQKSEHQEINLG